MTQFETFILGIVMAATMSPSDTRDESEDEFRNWCRFWDVAAPTWNRAARDHGWRFANSHLWNPHVI